MAEIVKKVCLCGDPCVGKTSLVRRFVTGKYDDGYLSTLGTVVSKKTITSETDKTTMMIWDISGQAEFRRVQASAFRDAGGAIAVCDATRPQTAENIKSWLAHLRESTGKDIPTVIFINKTDLVSEDSPEMDKVLAIVEKYHCTVYTTSAKTGDNVEDGFHFIASSIAELLAERKKNAAARDANEKLKNPLAFLDFMIDSFCDSFGDEEMGMHIVRKQVRDTQANFERPSPADVDKLIERFTGLVHEFKGPEKATTFKVQMIKAKDRTDWQF